MHKKYRVTLTLAEREECSATIWMRGGRQSGCEPGVAAEVMMVALIDARKRVVSR